MTRVAIIGGGIGGLTAARALSLAGVEVTVYEAAGELKEIGAGVALHANAMRVLRAIGVEDAVRKVAGHSQWAVTRDGLTGRIISKTSRKQQAATFGIEGATVHRADLLDVLARALPDGMVSLGKRCVEVLPGADVAVARFADGTEAEADVVIGADGIHSAVRASLFGPDAPRFTGKVCYRSVIPASAVTGPRPAAGNGQWLGPHGTIVLYPLRGEELINVVCHYDDDEYRHESWVTECERQEVLERYAGWHESLLRLFAAGETWYKWALYDRDPMPAWTRGRVTLLGDAAHPMLPYLGQGACQALEDGAVLATALTAEAADPVAALARYERTRRPRASRVVLTARERGLSNHLPSRWAAWRRDLAIAMRRRLNRRDPEGRGAAWVADYDATSPDILVALPSALSRQLECKCAHTPHVFWRQDTVVTKSATEPATSGATEPAPRKRLTAEARKSSILAAARRAFTETGDMNGTTIKLIAARSGISEGVIYRHFDSKDQLFFEAVVEPLQRAVDDLVAATGLIDRDEPLTPERQLKGMTGLYKQLVSTLEEVLPLLGLVLYGDPRVARKFYRENFSVAMDRLAQAWREVEDRHGFPFESPDIAARAVMGMAMLLALESHHGKKFDRNRAVSMISEGTVKGFFPAIGAERNAH